VRPWHLHTALGAAGAVTLTTPREGTVLAGVTTTSFVRRAPFLIAWWTERGARVCNYATTGAIDADTLALAILDRAARWLSVADLERELPEWDAVRVRGSVTELLAHGMLHMIGRQAPPEERALATWHGWNPAGGFFHRATRASAWAPVGPGGRPPLVCLQDATTVGQHRPGPRLELPEFERAGSLADTLLARRTWRRFGSRPVSLQELSTILGLSYGVQQWVDIEGERVPLRTSPSGGARHSIEAYVLVLDVDGLAPGTYHYCPDTHALLLVDATTSREDVANLFPAGSGFDSAAALVFATSVFARVQRKYDSPRAYRVVMLEAGHFCQTFCLVATSLGLAPFCTAAFVDDAVERMLGVDGIREAAIYAMGVGSRPEGAVWAPWPDGAEPPIASPPAFAARFSSSDPAPPES